MLRNVRHVLAVTLVATALCADRVASAAPTVRTPQVMELASQLVERLSRGFRQEVTAVRLVPVRQRQLRTCRSEPSAQTQTAFARPQPLSPFQFRLPPPTA